MRDLAIRNTHPTVVTINAGIDATDADGNPVTLDESAIATELAKLQAAYPLQKLRQKRNGLLAETDWWAGQDLIMSQAQKDYRQELRDLPSGLDTVEKVNAVTWPTKPE